MRLRLENLEIQYPGMADPLFRMDSREIEPGTRLLIRGHSGTGKTSLLHVLGGLLNDYRGTVEVEGRDLASLSDARKCRWRRECVGLIFQRLNLLGHLTALENVLLGSIGSSVSRQTARESLARLGMDGHADTLAYHLSLGEQQRVAVARVTARAPLFILADEPTSSLDDPGAERVIGELLEKVREDGILIVSTHDTRIAPHFHQVWTLREGTVHCE